MTSVVPSIATLSLSPTSPIKTDKFAGYESFNEVFDCIEHGMGFKRGELEEFVDSEANVLEMREDLIEACRNGEWVLVPEEEDLSDIIRLWNTNTKCKTALDERKNISRCFSAHGQISQPQGSLTKDGDITRYIYRLWHLPSLCIIGPDGKRTEPGVLRVSSTIPPYLWAVYASFFSFDHSAVFPLSSARIFHLLYTIHVIIEMPTIPRVFLDSGNQHKRPKCWCIEDEEERKDRQRRRFHAMVRRNLPKTEDEEMTEKQRRFLLQLYMLDVKEG
ncbi:hypothetical protein C8R44DRAFT_770865 [Mycena epipterygia]|nr:hypothetical protein C8R44DRAFT_770865 [Mycena epipterygia]